SVVSFVFTDTPTTELYTLSLHDALPIYRRGRGLLAWRCSSRHPPIRATTPLNPSPPPCVLGASLGRCKPSRRLMGGTLGTFSGRYPRRRFVRFGSLGREIWSGGTRTGFVTRLLLLS